MPIDYPNLTAEDLLPHSGKMLLIDEVLELGAETAVSRSQVNADWPLVEGQSAGTLLIVELVAQTSGLSNAYTLVQQSGLTADTKGWVVGIKKAHFYVDALPMGAWIVTRAVNTFKFDEFVEITGDARIDDEIIGEVVLQVMKAR